MSRILSLLWLLLAGPLLAFQPVSVRELQGRVVAIGGYDTVAYHTLGKPTRGSPIYSSEWQGAQWYFSRKSHKEAFDAAPEKYAPKVGGYCALCVGESGRAETDGDPEVFLIHEGELYLLASEELREQWRADPARHATQAKQHYASLLAALQTATPAPEAQR